MCSRHPRNSSQNQSLLGVPTAHPCTVGTTAISGNATGRRRTARPHSSDKRIEADVSRRVTSQLQASRHGRQAQCARCQDESESEVARIQGDGGSEIGNGQRGTGNHLLCSVWTRPSHQQATVEVLPIPRQQKRLCRLPGALTSYRHSAPMQLELEESCVCVSLSDALVDALLGADPAALFQHNTIGWWQSIPFDDNLNIEGTTEPVVPIKMELRGGHVPNGLLPVHADNAVATFQADVSQNLPAHSVKTLESPKNDGQRSWLRTPLFD